MPRAPSICIAHHDPELRDRVRALLAGAPDPEQEVWARMAFDPAAPPVVTAHARLDPQTIDFAPDVVLLGPRSASESTVTAYEQAVLDGCYQPTLLLLGNDAELSALPERAPLDGLSPGDGMGALWPRLVRALRMGGAPDTVALSAGRHLDLRTGLLTDGRGQTQLGETLLRTMRFLALRVGEPVERGALFDAVWPAHGPSSSRIVDLTVRRLRQLIESTPREPRHLITERGVGYRLRAEVERIDTGASGERGAIGPAHGTARPADLERVVSALERGPRVAVIGPGGVGKSHLAALAAEIWRVAGVGRVVRLCRLGHCRSAEAMLEALTEASGTSPPALSASPADVGRLVARGLSQGPPTLLLLDDLDRPMPPVTALLAALEHGARCRVLITARSAEGLAVDGAIELGDLPPEGVAAMLRDRLGPAAQHVDPALLDAFAGLLPARPLGIEIETRRLSTAPGLGADPSAAIRARIDDLRLRATLRGEGSEGPARQMDRLWDDLSLDMREVLSACATFEGPFGVGAAEAMLPTLDDAIRDIEEALDRGFLHPNDGSEVNRLVMPHAIRDVTLERIHPFDRDIHRERHSAVIERRWRDHMARVDARLDPGALGALALEVHDLVEAMRWAQEHQPGRAARLLELFSQFSTVAWQARMWRELLLESRPVWSRFAPRHRLIFTVHLSRLLATAGDADEARALADEARRLAERLDDDAAIVDAARNMALVQFLGGAPPACDLDALVERADRFDDDALRMRVHLDRWLIQRAEASAHRREGLCRAAIAVGQRARNRAFVRTFTVNLGWSRAPADPAGALRIFRGVLDDPRSEYHPLSHESAIRGVLLALVEARRYGDALLMLDSAPKRIHDRGPDRECRAARRSLLEALLVALGGGLSAARTEVDRRPPDAVEAIRDRDPVTAAAWDALAGLLDPPRAEGPSAPDRARGGRRATGALAAQVLRAAQALRRTTPPDPPADEALHALLVAAARRDLMPRGAENPMGVR